MTHREASRPLNTTGGLQQDLEMLVTMLRGIRGPIRERIPQAHEVSSFTERLLAALTSLTMLQQHLFGRVLRGEATLGNGPTPPWTEILMFDGATTRFPRITARKATRVLEGLFDSIIKRVGYENVAELSVIPPQPSDIPRLLALTSSAIDQLAWFLELELAPRILAVRDL